MALNADRQLRKQKKEEVCERVLSQLLVANGDNEAVIASPEELEAHFNRLPTRYALYLHIDRADDVLTHKRLLEEVKAVSENKAKFAFHVRALPAFCATVPPDKLPNAQDDEDEAVDDPLAIAKLSRLQLPGYNLAQPTGHEASSSEFNSSTELNIIDNYASENDSQSSSTDYTALNVPMHEVTISSVDKPKLLSQLSAMLADVGLNIREAHVFSTTDGFSLDVFVVDGWPTSVHSEWKFSFCDYMKMEPDQDVEDMNQALLQALSAMQSDLAPEHDLLLKPELQVQVPETISGGVNDWEIDSAQLKFIRKVTTGSYGDLYQGSYCGQDVAIKVLKSDRMNEILRHEFQQEVYIMRKVRHKNIVQFIGACTKSPNFCIVTEYMSGGNVYDYLHQQKAVLKMPMLLRVAIDVAKAMDYLHQNNIIHRDLKAANLLMDENEVVKVADFGVARVQAQSGIMTAETGTYRWMAPEVIEHKPYDCKADVFSFGIVFWELLTGQVPYSDLTPLQAAIGVVQKGLRPTIPENVNPRLNELLQSCWKTNSTDRPDFSEITGLLEEILKQVNQASAKGVKKKYKDKKLVGLFTLFKQSPIQG